MSVRYHVRIDTQWVHHFVVRIDSEYVYRHVVMVTKFLHIGKSYREFDNIKVVSIDELTVLILSIAISWVSSISVMHAG